MVVDEKKQLKVDNWGSFFLHRLFLLYEKGEKCDGTLLFKDGHSIKHLWTNDTFTLPPVLGHGAVLPIVNFMYTGFLNFNAEIHHAVFTAAKFLNVTILMKLLHAQLDNDSLPQPDSAADNINHSTTTSEPSSSSSSASPSLSASSVPPPSASSSSSSSPSVSVVSTKSVLRKVKKLPRIGKPLFLTPQPSSSSSTSSSSNSSFSVVASSAAAAAASSSQTVPGKKLPIWKKRTTTIAGLTSSGAPRLPADYYGSVDEAAEPLPSRCHLAVGEGLAEGVPGEGQLPPRAECPAYDTYNLATPSFHHQPRTLTEDIVKEFYRLNNKRPPPHLLMKAVAMVKDAIIAHNSSSDVTAMEVDDDDDDDGLVDEPMAMDDESVLMTSGVKRPTVQYGGKSAEEKFDRLTRLATPPKPILKPLTSDCVATGGGGSSSKKVRFSLAAEGKENTASANSVTAAAVSDTPTTALATPTTPPKGGGAKAAAAAASSPLIGGSKEVKH
ncbi:hypothetical protein LSTR_LSTR007895 [Laodelphax striatellus]|uniref:BTB domain-containing protein n=1 Tax=Laodelphax striatellus TaxID=195883 RepID=A0A482WXG9_LAOST|nr:hypothetical protein LSTR_LSTR007895 [Laodelphax striatellus]